MTLLIVCLLFCTVSAAVVSRATGRYSNSPACDSFAVPYNNSCYVFTKDLNNLEETVRSAIDQCNVYTSNLVSIHSSAENDFLRKYDPNALIGLRYDEGKFQWSDGTPVDYTNLKPDFVEKAEYFGYCATIGNTTWENAECENEFFPYICKKNPSEYPNTRCPDPDEIRYNAGHLHSLGWPFGYNEPGKCIYKLVVKNGMLIEAVFFYVNISTDTMQVYEGYNQKILLANITGFFLHQVFETKRLNRMMIVLNTGSNPFGRFYIEWGSINAIENGKNRLDVANLGTVDNLSEAFKEEEKENAKPTKMRIEKGKH